MPVRESTGHGNDVDGRSPSPAKRLRLENDSAVGSVVPELTSESGAATSHDLATLVTVTAEGIPKCIDWLLNQCDLVAAHVNSGKETRFRLAEVEAYCPDDPYTHGSPEQRGAPNRWYFHRAGKNADGKFRNGTFKGLDITCAPEGKPGGVLIRAIQDPAAKTYEGPCVSVNTLLAACGVESIAELVANPGFQWDATTERGLLRLEQRKHRGSMVLHGPRIGLGAGNEGFRLMPARYVVDGAKIKKMKKTLALP